MKKIKINVEIYRIVSFITKFSCFAALFGLINYFLMLENYAIFGVCQYGALIGFGLAWMGAFILFWMAIWFLIKKGIKSLARSCAQGFQEGKRKG